MYSMYGLYGMYVVCNLDLTCHGCGYRIGVDIGREHRLIEVGHKRVFHVHFVHVNAWKL